MALVVKNSPASAGDTRDVGSIPGSGNSLEEGMATHPGYSCLESPMDRGAWRAMVHRAAKSWTRLKALSVHAHVYGRVPFLSTCSYHSIVNQLYYNMK